MIKERKILLNYLLKQYKQSLKEAIKRFDFSTGIYTSTQPGDKRGRIWRGTQLKNYEFKINGITILNIYKVYSILDYDDRDFSWGSDDKSENLYKVVKSLHLPEELEFAYKKIAQNINQIIIKSMRGQSYPKMVKKQFADKLFSKIYDYIQDIINKYDKSEPSDIKNINI